MPVDREKTLQVAQKLVDKKRYDKAIVEYRKLVAEDAGDVRTLLKIGDLYLKVEKHEEAIATYEQVGEYYYREGFSVKAIAVYKQIRGIIKRHATHLEARYGHIVPRLAEIYSQLGLTSDALAAYDEVASRLRQEGRERDALDIFKKVLDLDPQNPIAHLRVADSYTRLGDLGKAIERFGDAARIMLKLGRHNDALKVLERLLQYRQEPEYARLAATIYLDRGGPNDGLAALAKLQLCYKADPKDLETLATLAAAFDSIEQPKKAVEVLKESARVAKEKNDLEAFDQVMTTLLERAPQDTQVQQLDQARRGPPSEEEISIIEVEEDFESLQPEPLDAPAPSSLPDEVMELDDADLQPADTDVGELFGANLSDETSAARRLANEADRIHSVGQLDMAIGLLRDGLRNLGSSAMLRQRLSDLLLEAGDQDGSINEKLELAQEFLTAGAIDGAMGMLDEVLLLQPDHPEANRLRAALGFGTQTATRVTVDGEQGIEDIELDAPLQSYDVESGGVDQLLNRTSSPSASSHESLAQLGIDEPFLHVAPPGAPVAPAATEGSQAAGVPRQLDEDALDQADGLAQAGRFEEARSLLAGQLQALPNHPLILERMAEVEQMAGAMVYAPQDTAADSGGYPAVDSGGYPAVDSSDSSYEGSAPYAPPVAEASHPHPPPAEPAQEPPPAVEPPAQQAPAPAAATPQPPQSAPRQTAPRASIHEGSPEVGAVLEQFREGIRQQIDEGDAQTHYDLGVAYNEMGLHSDAISELTLASRDPKRECVCLSMIGTVQLQMGEIDGALDALHRALNAEHKTPEQQKALAYEIANAYELNSMVPQAMHYFEWLATHHPDHTDPRGSVAERVQALRAGSGAQRRPLPPTGEAASEGDMDSALDDLFGGKQS